jgi:hypothetical protein
VVALEAIVMDDESEIVPSPATDIFDRDVLLIVERRGEPGRFLLE